MGCGAPCWRKTLKTNSPVARRASAAHSRPASPGHTGCRRCLRVQRGSCIAEWLAGYKGCVPRLRPDAHQRAAALALALPRPRRSKAGPRHGASTRGAAHSSWRRIQTGCRCGSTGRRCRTARGGAGMGEEGYEQHCSRHRTQGLAAAAIGCDSNARALRAPLPVPAARLASRRTSPVAQHAPPHTMALVQHWPLTHGTPGGQSPCPHCVDPDWTHWPLRHVWPPAQQVLPQTWPWAQHLGRLGARMRGVGRGRGIASGPPARREAATQRQPPPHARSVLRACGRRPHARLRRTRGPAAADAAKQARAGGVGVVARFCSPAADALLVTGAALRTATNTSGVAAAAAGQQAGVRATLACGRARMGTGGASAGARSGRAPSHERRMPRRARDAAPARPGQLGPAPAKLGVARKPATAHSTSCIHVHGKIRPSLQIQTGPHRISCRKTSRRRSRPGGRTTRTRPRSGSCGATQRARRLRGPQRGARIRPSAPRRPAAPTKAPAWRAPRRSSRRSEPPPPCPPGYAPRPQSARLTTGR